LFIIGAGLTNHGISPQRQALAVVCHFKNHLIQPMDQITQTLTPKEVIAHFNKKFIVTFLQNNGFEFKEKTLEYHRHTKDFKQVIWHRCDKNNISGVYIGFAMGSSILCPRFKSWYKKQYGKDPQGGESVIGYRRLPFRDQWNSKYNDHPGEFGYDLIKKNIDDQFAVILENLQNVILPSLNFYKDFTTVINNPNLSIQTGEFDLQSHLRQIEHCLFLGDLTKARNLADSLQSDPTIPESYFAYRDSELIRIFKTK